MVISNMPVLLILILVSLKLGLADVVTYDVACEEPCKQKCTDKGFKFDKCETGGSSGCSCTIVPCKNAKERCTTGKLSAECNGWKGSIYCNPKTNQCECTCDPTKCDQYCMDKGKKSGAKCEEDVSFGLRCVCNKSPANECDSELKAKQALDNCRQYVKEFKNCPDYGELVCSPQPKEVKGNRNPCKCNCDADKCTQYCKAKNKMGKCMPLDSKRAKQQHFQGETCKCT